VIGRVSFTTIDAVDPARLAAFWGEILALGGTWDRDELTLDEARWRTVRDPEGNEFDIFVTNG
jgi:hypothetical protein